MYARLTLSNMATPSEPRKVGQHHGDLRRALIDAALAAIAEGDLAELSLRKLAQRAGVSRAAPYHHFASKDALFAALASEGFAQLAAAQAQVATSDDPLADLRELAATYVRFACTHPTHYRVMFAFAPGSLADSPEGRELEVRARACFARLCSAHGAVDPDASETQLRQRALIAWATAHGAVQIAIAGLLEGLTPELDVDGLAARVGAATAAAARS